MTETQINDLNGMRRPSVLAAAGPYASWSSGTYAYDGAGNGKSIGTSSFTYDKVNRLISAKLFDGPTGGGNLKQQSYTFDTFGNITSITTNGAPVNTPTSTTTNRLTGAVTYDAAGNLTGWNGATYQDDRFNQMTRMASGNEDWTYIYTADDERIWSFSPALSRWTLRDLDGKVLREYLTDSRGWSVGTDYVYRNGRGREREHPVPVVARKGRVDVRKDLGRGPQVVDARVGGVEQGRRGRPQQDLRRAQRPRTPGPNEPPGGDEGRCREGAPGTAGKPSPWGDGSPARGVTGSFGRNIGWCNRRTGSRQYSHRTTGTGGRRRCLRRRSVETRTALPRWPGRMPGAVGPACR